MGTRRRSRRWRTAGCPQYATTVIRCSTSYPRKRRSGGSGGDKASAATTDYMGKDKRRARAKRTRKPRSELGSAECISFSSPQDVNCTNLAIKFLSLGRMERRGFLRSAKTAAVNKRDIIRMLCVLAYVAVGVCEVNKRQKEEKQKRIVFVVQQIYASRRRCDASILLPWHHARMGAKVNKRKRPHTHLPMPEKTLQIFSFAC